MTTLIDWFAKHRPSLIRIRLEGYEYNHNDSWYGFNRRDLQSVWNYQQAKIEQQNKELKALREYATVMISTQGKYFAKHYKLIDENGNPTKLLTGEKDETTSKS